MSPLSARDSDNRERLDLYNGLLLSPSYDAAFDAGLITFGAEGVVALSAELTPVRAERLGVVGDARVSGLLDRHRDYLEYHRRNVFIG